MKCIAFNTSTGERCRRPVGTRPFAQHVKLCATHSKSVWLTMIAPSLKDRSRLAYGRWTNVRQLND